MTERRLPWRQFVILSLCRFAEPIALTSVFPYLPEMIESFGVPKDEIAKWAGTASAIFSIGQCATSVFWGRASDKYGRKLIILLGLLNTMIMSLLWGFSTSLPMAMTARALQGAGNGNVGILRTMVAELCPWRELQPRAFSIMPLVFNVGSVFGPAIGGALSNPMHVDVSKPHGDSFFEKFPYALPNIVSAALFLVGIITGILFLHETLESKKGQKDYGLILGHKLTVATQNYVRRIKNTWRQARGEETEPLIPKRADSASSPGTTVHDYGEGNPIKEEPKPVTVREVLTVQSLVNLLIYTLLATHSLGYDQLLPVFMHHTAHPGSGSSYDASNPLKFSNGFGINSSRIGVLFTLYGALGIFYQLFLFPPIARRFGVLRCFQIISLAYPLLYIITPFTALLPTPLSQQVFMFAIMTVKGACTTFAFPCSTILLTNSASSLRVLGTLNGIATSVSAVGRAAGPAIGGALFTVGVKRGYAIVPFWVLAAISLIGAVPAFFLVEGKGFSADDESTSASPSPSDVEDNEDDYTDGYEADDGGRRGRGAVSHRDPEAGAQQGDEDEGIYGVPSALPLSRTTTVSSDAVSDTASVHSASPADITSPLSASLPRHRPQNSRGSVGAGVGRSVRRKTSVPIGMGTGFRRHSSNLGMSRDGYGTGQSFGG
ncbi:major facilitator superfamily domain-containing protein [Phyllosticta citribraziliensis]|uniref:Major facilitator superfamily domain-containing protein n=1 Tax=Phyllosticta citribraziliensis TaxID=989973 RepID=A0ABR1LQ98_9PEZI